MSRTIKFLTIALFVALLSSCSAENEEKVNGWLRKPAREMEVSDVFFIGLICAFVAHSSHSCNCKKNN